jgi:hypothetical protein
MYISLRPGRRWLATRIVLQCLMVAASMLLGYAALYAGYRTVHALQPDERKVEKIACSTDGSTLTAEVILQNRSEEMLVIPKEVSITLWESFDRVRNLGTARAQITSPDAPVYVAPNKHVVLQAAAAEDKALAAILYESSTATEPVCAVALSPEDRALSAREELPRTHGHLSRQSTKTPPAVTRDR